MFTRLGLLTLVCLLINLIHGSRAHARSARETYAYCQVKLLKAAVDGLVHEFGEHGQLVDKIHEITYNFNLEGKARVILLSTHLLRPDETCIVDVVTRASGEPDGRSCPEYTFEKVRTTCR